MGNAEGHVQRYVCFYLGGREHAAPIDEVRETVGLKPITPVFHTPKVVAGVANLRGEVLAVLDPGLLLGLAPSRRDATTRIVVLQHGDKAAGLLVDGLGSIRDIDDDVVEPVPATVEPHIARLFRGMVSLPERALGLLEPRALLEAPPLLPFAAADAGAAAEPS